MFSESINVPYDYMINVRNVRGGDSLTNADGNYDGSMFWEIGTAATGEHEMWGKLRREFDNYGTDF